MRYVLHIGLNKTGTSTLQTYFARTPKHVQKRGIWYPEFGRIGNAHHGVAQAIKRQDFAAQNLDEELLKGAGAPKNTKMMLLSSEAFQSIRDVGSVASYFPPDRTKVILYAREHVAHLASWYQEAVQSRDITCSFLQFSELRGYSIAERIDRWHEVYGESLIVRHYDREKLRENDIVVDFFATAFNSEPPTKRRLQSNPSISGNLLFIKLVLNHLLTADENQKILHGLSGLSKADSRFSGKMFISAKDAAIVARRFRNDRKALRDRYGIRFVPPEGLAGNRSPALDTLQQDIKLLLEKSRVACPDFFEIFASKRDLLFPVVCGGARDISEDDACHGHIENPHSLSGPI